MTREHRMLWRNCYIEPTSHHGPAKRQLHDFLYNRYLLGTGSNSLDPDQTLSFFFPKIVSMIRKYHNHKPKTNPWHREEEPHNHHETPGRQTKQSNQLSLQTQIVLTFQAFVRPSVYSQIGHLLASFLFYVVSIC